MIKIAYLNLEFRGSILNLLNIFKIELFDSRIILVTKKFFEIISNGSFKWENSIFSNK